jgi:hypothetical protein
MTATRAAALLIAAGFAHAGCATLTGTFELAGMHWSDGGSWKEVHPIHPERAVVGAVLVAPQGPHLTCYRTTEAEIVGFSARYSTMFKVLAGFMFVSEGAISGLLFSSGQTGGYVAGGIVGADALATLGLILFTHQKIDRTEAPPPQYTVVMSCPPNTGVLIGDRFAPVDETGAFSGDDAATIGDGLVADGPRYLRVAGRTVALPLTDTERAAKSPVLVVLERPSFVVPWPVETLPVAAAIPATSAVQ